MVKLCIHKLHSRLSLVYSLSSLLLSLFLYHMMNLLVLLSTTYAFQHHLCPPKTSCGLLVICRFLGQFCIHLQSFWSFCKYFYTFNLYDPIRKCLENDCNVYICLISLRSQVLKVHSTWYSNKTLHSGKIQLYIVS